MNRIFGSNQRYNDYKSMVAQHTRKQYEQPYTKPKAGPLKAYDTVTSQDAPYQDPQLKRVERSDSSSQPVKSPKAQESINHAVEDEAERAFKELQQAKQAFQNESNAFNQNQQQRTFSNGFFAGKTTQSSFHNQKETALQESETKLPQTPDT